MDITITALEGDQVSIILGGQSTIVSKDEAQAIMEKVQWALNQLWLHDDAAKHPTPTLPARS